VTTLDVEVTRNLVAQQLATRYRRAWMGVAWMTLVPLANMIVMGVALSAVLRVRSTEMIAHVIVSVLPFTLFQSGVLAATHSLVAYQDVIRRHSVHRAVFPLSALLVCVVEYLVASASLLVLGPLLGLRLGWAAAVVPLGFLSICGIAAGVGLLAAIGTVYFRDLGQLVQVGLNLLYWVTPIIYTREMLPEPFRAWLAANPLVSMLAMYTDPLIHDRVPPAPFLAVGPAAAVVFLVVGWALFRRHERRIVFHL
jgi:ABC-type polysaccharide/polyol phosphate export permease